VVRTSGGKLELYHDTSGGLRNTGRLRPKGLQHERGERVATQPGESYRDNQWAEIGDTHVSCQRTVWVSAATYTDKDSDNAMTGKYILDANGTPIECDDLLMWAQWFETATNRRVAYNKIPEGEISTVFLGLDHNFGDKGPPVLYETKVFGGILDGEQDRYSTVVEAKEGHLKMVERVLASKNSRDVSFEEV
jgi:hypothetical protein